MKQTNLYKFNRLCKEVRKHTLDSIYHAGSGHPGPSLSIVEILVYIFFYLKKKNEKLVLSKGHGVPSLYATLFLLGLIKKKELRTLRSINSRLQGHPGQGLSISIGYAVGFFLKKKKLNSFCILGDGELQEGQIWEAAMYAGANNISNLCAIIDNNKFQNETFTNKTLDIYPIKEKFKSFNWNVIEINGHDYKHIKYAFTNFKKENIKPTMIIANTIKGKGISFMENSEKWHAKKINELDYKQILKELNE